MYDSAIDDIGAAARTIGVSASILRTSEDRYGVIDSSGIDELLELSRKPDRPS